MPMRTTTTIMDILMDQKLPKKMTTGILITEIMDTPMDQKMRITVIPTAQKVKMITATLTMEIMVIPMDQRKMITVIPTETMAPPNRIHLTITHIGMNQTQFQRRRIKSDV